MQGKRNEVQNNREALPLTFNWLEHTEFAVFFKYFLPIRSFPPFVLLVLACTQLSKEIMDPSQTPANIFVSYASADEAQKNELDKHLSALKRQGLIRSFDAGQIKAGEEWNEKHSTTPE